MQRSTIPETIRLKIEFFAGRECEDCGRAIDSAMLQQHLEQVLHEIERKGLVVKRAAFQFELQQLCHECHERVLPRRRHVSSLLAQRRRVELEEYFQSGRAYIIGNPGLREPQREAYLATQEYFNRRPLRTRTADPNDLLPAIVEIPTGCGKTGIMCTVPYAIATGRVLIITPNLTIKRNLVKSMSPFDEAREPNEDNFFLKCGIFSDPRDLPKFVVLERGQANHEDCLRADIVITNIQQIQNWLRHFANDFFDMIIVDEAHHEPADSWQRVNDAFPGAKKLYLTATPFRADRKSIMGETVYRYRLAEAIRQGYVKNVMRLDAVASKMTFTLDGETREFSLEEILSIREELWFSKGVALSEVCNGTIVDRSISIWQEKRKSGVPHQIIGSACSIRHAIQLVELYQSRGIRATHVASEGMSMEERITRILDYEAGKYDCIVHVGILGEGYDNPNISVAAIFRPYRSLSPYAQFVGRTLRWIRGASTQDNLAHVVSHVGLNLNYLWEYYKSEAREANILSYLDQLFFNDENPGPPEEIIELDFELEEEPGAEVTQETIEGWDVDTFLPVAATEMQSFGPFARRAEVALATMNGRGFRNFHKVCRDRARQERLQELGLDGMEGTGSIQSRAKRSRLPENLMLPFNRPDLERKQYRMWLNKEVQRSAGRIMSAFHISPDDDLVDVIGDGDDKNNFQAIISSLHRAVNRLMGKDESSGSRNDWSLDELREARHMVSKAREAVTLEIRRKLQELQQQKLPFD